MSLYDYKISRSLVAQDAPFHALLMAAMRKADTSNQIKLQAMWPDIWEELVARYNAPGGRIGAEAIPDKCPGPDDPRCQSKCTLSADDTIRDPDCFR